MSNKTLIHFGIHKTGSSSIQNTCFLRDNHKKLRRKGLYFIQSIGDNHSRFFHSAFSDRPESYNANQKDGDTIQSIQARVDKQKSRIRDELRSVNNATVLFSGEDGSILTTEGMERLKAFTEEAVPGADEISVLVYTRDPVSYVESAVQENVKGNGMTLGDAKDWHVSVTKDRYRDIFEKAREAFGRENLFFRSFENAALRLGDVVLDFGEFVGVDFSNVALLRENPAICDEVVRIMSVLNEKGIALTERDRARLFRLPGQKRTLLTSEEAARVRELAESDMGLLSAEFGIAYSGSDQSSDADRTVFSERFVEGIGKIIDELSPNVRSVVSDILEHKGLSV